VLTITNLKRAYPDLSDEINKYLIHFQATKDIVHVEFLSYASAFGLVYSEPNILFDVKNPYELMYFQKFYRVKYINFYIDNPSVDEFKSLKYLSVLLDHLPNKTFKDKIIKLVFQVNTEDGMVNYSYILDYNTVMIANFNQFRMFTDNKLIGRIEWRQQLINLLYNKFNNYNWFECMYSKHITENYRGLNKIDRQLFVHNIVNELPRNSIVLYTKLDDQSEAYSIGKVFKEFINNSEFGMDKSDLLEMQYFTKEILNLILFKYVRHNKIYTFKDEELYVKFWNDVNLKKFIPLTRKELKAIKGNDDLKTIIKQLQDNKITVENLTDLMCNLFLPVDKISLKDVLKLVMLPKRKYYDNDVHNNILKFLKNKTNNWFEGINLNSNKHH
jgi:hypothetical protein